MLGKLSIFFRVFLTNHFSTPTAFEDRLWAWIIIERKLVILLGTPEQVDSEFVEAWMLSPNKGEMNGFGIKVH